MTSRRNFVRMLGGAAAWPLAARAQQAMPAVGFLSSISAVDRPNYTEAFRQGLNATGYAEGRNYTMDYIDLQGRTDRYGDAMQQLVDRKSGHAAAPPSTPRNSRRLMRPDPAS